MTSPTPSSLAGLAERVAAATGPDREIDRDLMALSYKLDRRHIGCRCYEECCPGSRHIDTVWVDPSRDAWVTDAEDGYEFTASLDRALALVERVLPDTDDRLVYVTIWAAKRKGVLRVPAATIHFQCRDPDAEGGWALGCRKGDGVAETPALALLSALLATLSNPQEGEPS